MKRLESAERGIGRGWAAAALLLALGLAAGPALPGGTAAGQAGGDEPEAVTLSLDDALRRALDRNRDLRRAEAEVEEAGGMVTEAWGNLYPQIDLTTQYSRNLAPPVSFIPEIFFNPEAEPDDLIRLQFGADNVWTNSIVAEQILFDGRAFVGVGAAGRFHALQEETYRGVTHEVATRVRMVYYDLLLLQEQARLLERSVDRVRESLDETRALERAGLASDYDVLRLEVELANLEPQLRRARNQARAKERELVTELDMAEGTRIEVTGSLARMDPEDPEANEPENRALLELMGVPVPDDPEGDDLEVLLDRARVTSARLQQAEMNVELRRTELRLERAERLPRLFLFGSLDVQAQQDGSPDFFGRSGQRGYGRIVGLRVSMPIFTGFQRRGRASQRAAAVRSASLEREMAESRLRDRIRNLLEEVEEARLRVRGQRLAVEQAERGYEIASAQFREGVGSQLELTDAEVALRQSEFNLAEAMHAYLAARAGLDEAVGEVPLPGGRRAQR